MPAPWFCQENQSGTSTHGIQPPVTTPAASRSRPIRYSPRFCCGPSSTINTTRSGRPEPVTSATATPAPWLAQENQSGTSTHGVQPPVTTPAASRSRPIRYSPRFCCGPSSTINTTRSGRPEPVRSARAASTPWFSQENQSGTAEYAVGSGTEHLRAEHQLGSDREEGHGQEHRGYRGVQQPPPTPGPTNSTPQQWLRAASPRTPGFPRRRRGVMSDLPARLSQQKHGARRPPTGSTRPDAPGPSQARVELTSGAAHQLARECHDGSAVPRGRLAVNAVLGGMEAAEGGGIAVQRIHPPLTRPRCQHSLIGYSPTDAKGGR